MRRSGTKIMGQLIGLVFPLMHYMVLAILMGILGFLSAVAIPALGSAALLKVAGMHVNISFTAITWGMLGCALLRGVLRYGEQACNHYIAFKILALIRHKVFEALRKLAPAKLEGREKGNLISVITSDIELIEVFYAHTISPIAIAVFTSGILLGMVGRYHDIMAIIMLFAHLCVGAVIPLWVSGKNKEAGTKYRHLFGELNSSFLDNLRGMKESIQYGAGEEKLQALQYNTDNLNELHKVLKREEGNTKALSGTVILLSTLCQLFVGTKLYLREELTFEGMVLSVIILMSSFGAVMALSSLSNNLAHTLASAERVLELLAEQPAIAEVAGNETTVFGDLKCREVSFGYNQEKVLKNISLSIRKHRMLGIYGSSGCGKSTLLKLIMRFFDVDKGEISLSGTNLAQVNTKELRAMEGYMTQETHLFHSSIRKNIAIAKPGATKLEIEAAAKKASIHEFIKALPNGYETRVSELGESLSGGERQRIGLARVFLKDAPIVLLDEPTSNLDSLNEGMILKAVKETCQNKMVIMVSHRKSALNIADDLYKIG